MTFSHNCIIVIIVPSGAAESVNVTVLSSEEALVVWEAPAMEDWNGIIAGYAVNVSLTRTGQSVQQLLSNSTGTGTESLLLTNLRPFTTYSCRVAARTSVGVGPYSIATNFITLEAGKQVAHFSGPLYS